MPPHERLPFSDWFKRHANSGSVTPADANMVDVVYSRAIKPATTTAEYRRGYNVFARHYRNFLNPARFAKDVDYVIAHAHFSQNHHVLAFCSGISLFENYIAKHIAPSGRVVAVDVAEKMHDEGRKIAAAEGVHNIEFVTSSVYGYKPEQHRFNTVISIDPNFHKLEQIESQILTAKQALVHGPESRFILANVVSDAGEAGNILALFSHHGMQVIDHKLELLPNMLFRAFFTARPTG